MSALWRDVEPFMGLMLTTVLLIVFASRIPKHARASSKAEQHGLLQRASACVAVLAAMSMVVLFFNVPGMLQATHPDVVKSKAVARSECQQFLAAFEFGKAESIIRNNTLGATLAAGSRASRRRTLAHTIMPFVNAVLARVGVLCAVLPFLVVLVADTIARWGKGRHFHNTLLQWSTPLSQMLPSDADWSLVILPALYAATAQCWVVNLAFHLWLRERQVTGCMILSGQCVV